jgi:hypothetical protein
MAVYFFHLATPGKLVVDEEGRDLPGLEAATQEAVDSARDIIADALKDGSDVHGFAFNVTDDRGQQVMIYDFNNQLNGGSTAPD